MRPPLWLIPPALLSLILIAGCESEPRMLNPDAARNTNAAAAPAPAEPEKIELKPIIGAKTTEIRDAATELEEGGAQVSSGKITAKDPITIQGNAYVSIVGQASVLQIQHALNLYHAMNEKYPANLDEFMKEIIQANGIALPQLPYYQEYGYDAENHRLVVLEYPDRKAQFQKQQDERFGRR